MQYFSDSRNHSMRRARAVTALLAGGSIVGTVILADIAAGTRRATAASHVSTTTPPSGVQPAGSSASSSTAPATTPATSAPDSEAPDSEAPDTQAPVTDAPTTAPPTTAAPVYTPPATSYVPPQIVSGAS